MSGLADSLRNELLLYNIGVTLYCPANMDTDGFKEEEKIKPQETKTIEGPASVLTADQAAELLIQGMQSGRYQVVSEFFPSDIIRILANPIFTPRHNLLLDFIVAPILMFVSPFFVFWADKVVKDSRKLRSASKKQN